MLPSSNYVHLFVISLILVLDSLTKAVVVQVKNGGANYSHSLSSGSIQLADPFPESWAQSSKFRDMSWYKVGVDYKGGTAGLSRTFVINNYVVAGGGEWNKPWENIEGFDLYQFWGFTIETPTLNTTGSYVAVYVEPENITWVTITVVDAPTTNSSAGRCCGNVSAIIIAVAVVLTANA